MLFATPKPIVPPEQRFIACHPERRAEWYCQECCRDLSHHAGVLFRYDGYYSAWRCEKCGEVWVDERSNPFVELNEKLDRLLSRIEYDEDW